MRVAVIGKSDQLGSFAFHISEAFRENGHHSIPVGIQQPWQNKLGTIASLAKTVQAHSALRSPRAARASISRPLTTVRNFKPDLIVTTLGSLGRHGVDALRDSSPNAPIVLWYPDAVSNFGNQSALNAGFDRIYVKDPYIVRRLRDVGYPEIRYLPEAAPSAALTWRNRVQPTALTENLCVVGNIYPTRIKLLQQLSDLKVNLELFGHVTAPSLPHQLRDSFTGRYLIGDDKYRIFSQSAGVLNNLFFGEVESVNYRLFEAAASGGVVYVDDVPQVRRYFEPGREIVVFSNAKEIAQTLGDLDERSRAEIAAKARARVADEHLLTHRTEAMVDDLGLC